METIFRKCRNNRILHKVEKIPKMCHQGQWQLSTMLYDISVKKNQIWPDSLQNIKKT